MLYSMFCFFLIPVYIYQVPIDSNIYQFYFLIVDMRYKFVVWPTLTSAVLDTFILLGSVMRNLCSRLVLEVAPWFPQNVCPTWFSLGHTLKSSYLASPRHLAIWQTRKAEWEMTAALLGFLWFQFDDRVRISMLLANEAVQVKQRVRVSDIDYCKVLYNYGF